MYLEMLCGYYLTVKVLSDGIRIDTVATDIKVTNIQYSLVETGLA